jgi:hypothetical protein
LLNEVLRLGGGGDGGVDHDQTSEAELEEARDLVRSLQERQGSDPPTIVEISVSLLPVQILYFFVGSPTERIFRLVLI